MGFILTNGDTYISKPSSGRAHITYDQQCATVYATESMAWNVLERLPKAYKQQKYLPRRIDSESYKKPETKSKTAAAVPADNQKPASGRHEPVFFAVKDSEWLAQFKKNLMIVDETLGSLNDLYSKVYGDLTEASNDLEDLSHAMEFINANAVQRCFLENEFKLARRKRRECKDAMMLIELVSKFEQSDWGSGKLTEALDLLDKRTYTPKNRDDLFK